MRFPDNAKVCFIGDSLTQANETLPRIIHFYNENFPEANVRFFNCGTSGGTYKSAIQFFYDDVLRHNPTHAVVAFGVNDSNRWYLGVERGENRTKTLKSSFESFQNNVKSYCKMLQENNISVTLCTPAPYDEYTDGGQMPLKGGYALVLAYAQVIKEFAKENQIPVCDYHGYITDCLQMEKNAIYSLDRVHPLPYGYYLMAKCFLAYQGYDLGEIQSLPAYFEEWAAAVRKMRMIYGAEQMIIDDYAMDLEKKMMFMEKKLQNEDWGQPIFESLIRIYVKEKRKQNLLYKTIDELYERSILQHI